MQATIKLEVVLMNGKKTFIKIGVHAHHPDIHVNRGGDNGNFVPHWVKKQMAKELFAFKVSPYQ